ncbi:hypothetical protein K491DRAFT_119952 [Lophiostoma macrostomum CBS 122681]|uniref:Uncharacterized protein n=1 Tax=Lophiostoma macrostomum CBS 122681 TaxID=1314788 RepID=A0A6A6SSV0_9PLEO|nr:hypothetical protein K491DRAFT_119952 [Lophiostoma macrostomum CBS 122681]
MSAGFSHGPQNGKDPTTKPPTHGYATVMTQLTSITLGSFWTYALDKKIGDVQDLPVPRLRIDHDTLVKQPIVLVSCEVSTRYNDSDAHGVTFPAVESQWQDDSAYQQSMFSIDENDDFLKKLPNDKTNFNWFKDPRPGFNSTASLYAVLIVPFNSTNATSNFTTQASAITACSIDARWATSDVWYEPTNSTFVNSNVSIGLFQDINAGYDPSFRSQYGLSEMPVDLKVDWAEFLDEEQESKNTSMVELLELPVTHYDDTGISTFRVPGVDGSNFDGAFEAAISMLLSVVVADGMARSASYGRQPYYATWSNKTQVDYTPLPLYRLPGSFTPQTFNKTFEAHLKANGTLHKISVDVDHYGYGYLMQNTTSRWAMICLFVYALGVCIHVLYILAALCFGRYVGGKCWNNVGDLVALAMNSSPTARLHGTSAGVKEKEIWKDVVKVRETGGKHLELCFVQGRDEEMGAIVGGKKEKSYH